MSGPNVKSVTHDSFGTAPAATDEKLTFELKWKNSGGGANNDENIPVKLTSNFDTTKERNWNSFKNILNGVASVDGHTITERVTYVDSDGDEIPIESQCEFDEALKFAKTRATKKQSVFLIVEKNNVDKTTGANREVESSEKGDLICLEAVASQKEHKQVAMPPMQLDEGVRRGQWQSQCCNATQATQADGLGDTAPKWFTNYMQMMKEDIVTEVSNRVTKTVMDALSKKRESQYDSATSHPHASDSDCLLDSDLDDDRSECNSINSWDFEYRTEITKSPVLGRFDKSRRRYRHADKQRKKHNKNHVSQTPCNDETLNPPYINRGTKPAEKREINKVRASLQSSVNAGRSEQQIPAPRSHRDFVTNVEEINTPSINRDEKSANARETGGARALPLLSDNSACSEQQISASKSHHDFVTNTEEMDTPYRRMMASGIRQTSFTPVNSDMLEAPILKLRLAATYNGNGQQNIDAKVTDDKFRMGCSVTGQDMLERPNDRVPEYDALSDSDNISIISDVSHASDMQRINNSFEMILQRSMNFSDEPEIYGNMMPSRIESPVCMTIPTEMEQYFDNTRDSSSFELLSEPPSPALSIHMDEDHFSPGGNETGNYNINDETNVDKRGNQSKIEICPYAIDAQGKIYQQNIIEGDEVSEEIVLEKRSGGAYSYVGETLPGSTRESMIVTESREEESTEEVPNATAEDPDNVVCDVGIEVTIETKLDSDCRGNSTDSFHESTQSFHSHTASQAENNRQDFASTGEREEAPGTPRTRVFVDRLPTDERDKAPGTLRSRVFVDRNASKGLGDTRRTSPRKQPSASNKNHEEARSERPRSTRKTSHDSHASGNRNFNPRQGESEDSRRSRRFGNWSTTRNTRMMDDIVFNAVDPMHILPETLVTGAVHVASSAYTTARRVYDKILTAQTRKPADKSKFGRR